MKNLVVTLLLVIFLLPVKAQYITEVYEYTPAPGQRINIPPWGVATSAESLIGGLNGSVSLGAYGGYIVFGFGQSVENNPDNPYGVDFIVYGNALNTWSEPGVVYVMKDENANGQPDDTWYEIAGSDYYFSSTTHDYQITYYNPLINKAIDVPWTDNYGNAGTIVANPSHTHSYYPTSQNFPNINQSQYSLQGTKIEGCIDMTMPAFLKSYKRGFGYADNINKVGYIADNVPDNPYTYGIIENSGADGIDISWAVDAEGNYVDLDKIDFVKVQSAILANAGWLGELSTEIRGAVIVQPDASISGVMDMVYLKDEVAITETPYQIEYLTFTNGKLANHTLNWNIECDEPSVQIDDEGRVFYDGNITETTALITAAMTENPEIKHTITVKLLAPSVIEEKNNTDIAVYPNPTDSYLYINEVDKAELAIYNLTGGLIMKINYNYDDLIDVSSLSPGIYIMSIIKENEVINTKFVKH